MSTKTEKKHVDRTQNDIYLGCKCTYDSCLNKPKYLTIPAESRSVVHINHPQMMVQSSRNYNYKGFDEVKSLDLTTETVYSDGLLIGDILNVETSINSGDSLNSVSSNIECEKSVDKRFENYFCELTSDGKFIIAPHASPITSDDECTTHEQNLESDDSTVALDIKTAKKETKVENSSPLKSKSLMFSVPTGDDDGVKITVQVTEKGEGENEYLKRIVPPTRSFSARPMPNKVKAFTKQRPKTANITQNRCPNIVNLLPDKPVKRPEGQSSTFWDYVKNLQEKQKLKLAEETKKPAKKVAGYNKEYLKDHRSSNRDNRGNRLKDICIRNNMWLKHPKDHKRDRKSMNHLHEADVDPNARTNHEKNTGRKTERISVKNIKSNLKIEKCTRESVFSKESGSHEPSPTTLLIKCDDTIDTGAKEFSGGSSEKVMFTCSDEIDNDSVYSSSGKEEASKKLNSWIPKRFPVKPSNVRRIHGSEVRNKFIWQQIIEGGLRAKKKTTKTVTKDTSNNNNNNNKNNNNDNYSVNNDLKCVEISKSVIDEHENLHEESSEYSDGNNQGKLSRPTKQVLKAAKKITSEIVIVLSDMDAINNSTNTNESVERKPKVLKWKKEEKNRPESAHEGSDQGMPTYSGTKHNVKKSKRIRSGPKSRPKIPVTMVGLLKCKEYETHPQAVRNTKEEKEPRKKVWFSSDYYTPNLVFRAKSAPIKAPAATYPDAFHSNTAINDLVSNECNKIQTRLKSNNIDVSLETLKRALLKPYDRAGIDNNLRLPRSDSRLFNRPHAWAMDAIT